jgi:hypothetical protein
MPAATLIALTQMTMNGARCQALFSSGLQPSDAPTADMVATAISRAVQQFGAGGCAGRMAQEFGDHPDAAARRMRWVRQLIAQEPAADRPQAGHERDLRPVRTCGPGGLPRVPARPALPGLSYQRKPTISRRVDEPVGLRWIAVVGRCPGRPVRFSGPHRGC